MATPAASPRISVAMATYNGAKHIREQLDSIARQQLLPVELVITDDGSTDATLQIVDAFSHTAPFPVRVFRNETRLGYADNFLKAASLCRGDLIAFCDQDDIWMEQKLSVCAGFFNDPAIKLVAHSAWTLLENGERGHRFPNFTRTKARALGSANPFDFVHGFAMIFRRELIYLTDTKRRPARLLGHDQWLWFLAASTGKLVTIADPLAHYRQHHANLFGARQAATMKLSAERVANTLAYDGLAASEHAAASVLLAAAEQNPTLADRLNHSAGKLEFRARLHCIRTRIYAGQSNTFGRIFNFCHILVLGGYLPDRSGTRLGIRAAFKDFLFGVPGIYKILARRYVSSQTD